MVLREGESNNKYNVVIFFNWICWLFLHNVIHWQNISYVPMSLSKIFILLWFSYESDWTSINFNESFSIIIKAEIWQTPIMKTTLKSPKQQTSETSNKQQSINQCLRSERYSVFISVFLNLCMIFLIFFCYNLP